MALLPKSFNNLTYYFLCIHTASLPLGDLGILLCEGEFHIEGKIVSNLLMN